MAEKLCPLIRRPAPPAHSSHTQPSPIDEPAPCIEHRCRWYTQLLGKNPQTGDPVPEWGCAVEFIPILLCENANQQRQHAASVDAARNEAQRDSVKMAASIVEFATALRETRQAAPAGLQELNAPSVWRRLLRRSQ